MVRGRTTLGSSRVLAALRPFRVNRVTLTVCRSLLACPPTADILGGRRHVSNVPLAWFLTHLQHVRDPAHLGPAIRRYKHGNRVIQASEPGATNHEIRTHGLSVDCHQAVPSEQAARRPLVISARHRMLKRSERQLARSQASSCDRGSTPPIDVPQHST